MQRVCILRRAWAPRNVTEILLLGWLEKLQSCLCVVWTIVIQWFSCADSLSSWQAWRRGSEHLEHLSHNFPTQIGAAMPSHYCSLGEGFELWRFAKRITFLSSLIQGFHSLSMHKPKYYLRSFHSFIHSKVFFYFKNCTHLRCTKRHTGC